MGAPEGDHTGKWGYPLWIAPAGADKDHLVQALVQEINCLQKGQDRHGNPFYVLYRGFNQMVRVQICPFTWICDKPEKAHITHTLGGSRSLYHLRYGYSIAYTCVCPSWKNYSPAMDVSIIYTIHKQKAFNVLRNVISVIHFSTKK